MLVKPVEVVAAQDLGGVHFIAIGGAGMSGIARLMLELGIPVSGSDQADSAAVTELRARGATVHLGHAADQVGPEVHTVVVSSAIRESNPELVEARRRGLRVLHRSAALASLMVGRQGVAVAGTHGKTTTSAMTAVTLAGAGQQPSYVIGAPLANTGTSAEIGRGPAFVVEADESDGSFLQYPATIGVITNIEADHLDNWQTPQAYAAGYREFAAALDVVIINIDDAGARALADELQARDDVRVVTCGTNSAAQVRLDEVSHTADAGDGFLARARVTRAAEAPTHLRLRVPGLFNLHNAVAAWAVARELGVDAQPAAEALAEFTGTHRRFEFVGDVDGVRVFDDYAHHPTEVAATLTAAQAAVASPGRVIACFQPHLFSRTRDFATEFGQALRLADVVVVLDIYPAREDPIPGVTAELVVDATRQADPELSDTVHWCRDLDRAPSLIADLAAPGDLILTLGAGDVTTLGPRLVTALSDRRTTDTQ